MFRKASKPSKVKTASSPPQETEVNEYPFNSTPPSFEPGDIKAAMGFNPNDPNVTVKFIPAGEIGGGIDEVLDNLFGIGGGMLGVGGGEPVTAPVTAVEDRLERLLDLNGPMREILSEVLDEVVKATEKHAPMHSPHEGYSVILEELDELWDEVKADRGRQASARKEAKQVAATAIRYMLDLDPR